MTAIVKIFVHYSNHLVMLAISCLTVCTCTPTSLHYKIHFCHETSRHREIHVAVEKGLGVAVQVHELLCFVLCHLLFLQFKVGHILLMLNVRVCEIHVNLEYLRLHSISSLPLSMKA